MPNLPPGVDEEMVERARRAYLRFEGSGFEKMRAALTAALGDTHFVVPKEPSDEMLLAPGVPYGGKIGVQEGLALRRAAYRAMISAASNPEGAKG